MMALLRLTLVFVLVVILIRRKVSLGTALLAGALALGISSGMGPWPLARAVAASLADHRTLLLAAVVSLILVLSHLLEQTGQMRRLLSAYQGFSANPRLNLTLFPALIGLLPMPGGAVFSAPMVEEISRGSGLPAQHKALVNYWFRHLWEFCWPLYPGVILTVALSGIPLWVWVACQAPLALAMAGAGYLVLLRPLKPGNGSGKKGPRNLKGFFLELVPVLIVVAGAAALSPAFRAAAGALGRTAPPAEAGLLAALAAAIAWTGAANRVGAALLRKVLFNRSLASMVYMIAGIMVFSGVMDLSGTVGGVSSVFSGGGAPVFAATVALPMVVGLVTGITVAFVGATFPIVFTLVSASGLESHLLAFAILAFSSGYVGVLASPVHACLVLTQDYFKAPAPAMYRSLLPLCGAVFLAGLAAFGLAMLLT